MIWVSTHQNGVMLLINKKLVKIFNSERSGLLSDICKLLFIDGQNHVWVGTNLGLNEIIYNPVNDQMQIHNYTSSDGLPDNDVTGIAVSDRYIWVATVKGLARLLRNSKVLQRDFPLYITGIKINGRDTCIVPEYQLNHTQNNIQLEFVGINFRSDGRLGYKYRLSPEAPWEYTNLPIVNLSSLGPGNHTFEVYAKNIHGKWNDRSARASFFIAAPFWQRKEFLVFFIGALVVLIFTGFQLNYNKLKKRSEEKALVHKSMVELELLALKDQINPHFIFNCLNSIQNFIINQDHEKAHLYLAKFATLIRNALKLSRNNFISLRDEMDLLRTYVELESMRLGDSFSYNFSIDDELSGMHEIPSMILQPYVENAIKHGLNFLRDKKGLLAIGVEKRDNKIICTISDNGIGIRHSLALKQGKHYLHQSQGISLVERRIQMLNEQFGTGIKVSITDRGPESGGTLVTLSMLI